MTEKNWKNRITGYGEESPDQLLANPHNHRIHPKRQQDALGGSLDTLGYIQTVIVNRATGHIVDGHLRVTMALREGQKSIPVTYVELTEEEEAQALLSLDPIAAMAATDKDKVDELLRMVNTDNEQVMKHLSDFAAENKLDWGQPEQVDAEPEIDRAAELAEKWQTASGQLWKLGEHRLLIGDCTVRENVERLMGGERAGILLQDPPYGMNLDADYSKMPQVTVKGNKYDNVIGDNVEFDFSQFSYIECKEQFWWGADYYADKLPKGGSWYVWDKRNDKNDDALGSGFELCWSKTPHKRRLLRYLWSGFTARDPNEKRNHPTQKPIAMYQEIINEHSNDGEIVVDTYAGSGTTIIAAHNLNRRCFAMEISEKYGAVILERFHVATGIMPELLNQGSQK